MANEATSPKEILDDTLACRAYESPNGVDVRSASPNKTDAFDCGAHDYRVKFDDTRVAHLSIDAPGVDAHAQMTVKLGARASESVVTLQPLRRSEGIHELVRFQTQIAQEVGVVERPHRTHS